MPDTERTTPMQSNIADLADEALKRGKGIACHFDNADYLTPDACKKAMLTFRNSFYTMKAKERRRMRRLFGQATTPLDVLGCFIEETATGWCVKFTRQPFANVRVVDAETGEPINLPEYTSN